MPKLKARRKKEPILRQVPYAKGFRPPTATQRLRAVASCRQEEIGIEYSEGNSFSPIPKPASIDDWLAQYNEEGQSYSHFLRECPWLSRRKVRFSKVAFNPNGTTLAEKYPDSKIYLLPLGDFDCSVTPNFDDLAEYTRQFFHHPVEVLPPVQLSVDKEKKEVFWVDHPKSQELIQANNSKRKSSRVHRYLLEARFHAGRYQLQAASVLLRVKEVIPPQAICLVALTMSDIYDSPPDLFVAGLAAGNNGVGVFSLKRYDPAITFSIEHWHQITQTNSKITDKQKRTTLLQRSCRLLVHEVAHLLGVDHCIWYCCCMNGSGHLSEDFQQSMHLCPVDLRKLQCLFGFDVVERYRKLGEFFKRHGLAEERKWIERRLYYISSNP